MKIKVYSDRQKFWVTNLEKIKFWKQQAQNSFNWNKGLKGNLKCMIIKEIK